MRPWSHPLAGALLILVGLATLGWSWWPMPRRAGSAGIASKAVGAPHLEARWDVPARLRRGEAAKVLLHLSRPAEAAGSVPQTPEPARVRLTLERRGLTATPEAPLEIAFLPGESVSVTWQVKAEHEASARWKLEWLSGSESLPVWLHVENWPVESLFGLPVPVARALGSMLIAVGMLRGWLQWRKGR